MTIYKKENIDSFHKIKAPENFAATKGDVSEEIDLQWEPVNDAKYYILQYSSPYKNSGWREIDIVFKSSHTVANLKSGRKFRFRIASVNSKGRSCWSSEILKAAC